MPSIQELLAKLDYGAASDAGHAAQAWLANHAEGCGHCIAGGLQPYGTRPGIAVHDPAKGTVIGQVALGSPDDIAWAIRSAREALPAWSALSGPARARQLRALAALFERRQELFAALASRNDGKPVRESRDFEVAAALRALEYHASAAELLATASPARIPVGVCALISAAEFSLLDLVTKLGPALAAGNTVVIKPSEIAPLTATALAELCGEAGLPPGVVNLIHGNALTGAALAAHAGVDLVAFSGSPSRVDAVRGALAASAKQLVVQASGPVFLMVFEEADLDAAVEGVVEAVCSHRGQCGTTGTRLLMQEGIAEVFLGKLRARMEHLRLGDPLDPSTDLGSLVTPARLDALRAALASALRDGAAVWQPGCALPATGCFHAPALLTGMIASRSLPGGGIRGPVVVADSFRTADEAVALTREAHPVRGLAIWSEDFARALDTARRVNVPTVWLNPVEAISPCGDRSFAATDSWEDLQAYLKPAWMCEPAARPEDPGSGDGGALPPGQSAMPAPDLRRAIDAAAQAGAWSAADGAERGRSLRRVADALAARSAEFECWLKPCLDDTAEGRPDEVAAAVARIHHYAAWCTQQDRPIATAGRPLTLALAEPWGVIGVVSPETPALLGMLSLVLPAISLGNRVVLAVAQAQFRIAQELQTLCASANLPPGVLGVVSGDRDALADRLAAHEVVAALWYVGSGAATAGIAQGAAAHGKPVWLNHGQARDWWSDTEGQGPEFLRRAIWIKSIRLPG